MTLKFRICLACDFCDLILKKTPVGVLLSCSPVRRILFPLRGDDHLSAAAIARRVKRRGEGRTEPFAFSFYPSPPCTTMSLPSWTAVGGSKIHKSDARPPFKPEAFHIPPYGGSSLWHWSSCTFTGYVCADGCYPHGVPSVSGRSST